MNSKECAPINPCLSSAGNNPSLIKIEHIYGQHDGFSFICDADKLVELFPLLSIHSDKFKINTPLIWAFKTDLF